jgi:hypothetical protein
VRVDVVAGPALTLLALAGLAGVADRLLPVDRVDVHRSRCLEARVRAPAALHENVSAPVDVEVRNTSSTRCDLVVTLSAEYARSFREVAMIPEPAARWSVRLDDVAPGEERLVSLELAGGAPGAHDGEVVVRASSGDELAVPLHTIVVP